MIRKGKQQPLNSMMMTIPTSETDTIVAVATPGGRSAIQVIRVSGSEAAASLQMHTGRVPEARRMRYATIKDRHGHILDKGMVVFFPAPASPTGEDYAEFHLHGSPQIATLMLRSLTEMPGLRLAEAGEFTRRSFFHGKLSLDQAEAMADMIDADTIAQHRQAMHRFDKPLSSVTETWRQQLVSMLADSEASLDFADEDIPNTLMTSMRTRIRDLIATINTTLADAKAGAVVRDGMHIVLLGRPNAGKSTLLNALLGREDAIVSAEAGTTRDIIQATLDMEGYAVCLKDTAGIRAASGAVEQEGIERATDAARNADMVVCLIESGSDNPPRQMTELLTDAGIDQQANRPSVLPIISKADLTDAQAPRNWLAVSAKFSKGLDAVRSAIKGELDALVSPSHHEAALVIRQRHRLALEQCVAALQASSTIDPIRQPELLAEELRLAAQALGRIAGRVDVEDILDEIFASFCIGK